MCIIILRSWRRRKKFEKHFTHWNVSIIDIVIFNKLFFLFNEIYTHGTSNNKSNEKFSMTGSPYHHIIHITTIKAYWGSRGWNEKAENENIKQWNKFIAKIQAQSLSVASLFMKWKSEVRQRKNYLFTQTMWYGGMKNYIDFLFRSLDNVFFDILICMQVMLARK